ncbi:MAG: hypothetical protein ABFR19_09160 [Pseudomonadota bacterium]
MKTLSALLLLLLISTTAVAEYRAYESPFVTGMRSMLDAMEPREILRDGVSRRYGRLIESPFGDEATPFERAIGVKPLAPELRVEGRWKGKSGDGLWIMDGWVRFYNQGEYHDARLLVGKRLIYVGIPESGRITRFEYGLRGNLLALRDGSGTLYLYQRSSFPSSSRRESKQPASEEQPDTDDE